MPAGHSGAGVHHLHKRKRGVIESKPLKKKSRFIEIYDKILTVLAVIGPCFTLPQIVKIFMEKSAEGVSLLSWVGYTLIAIPWLIYGFLHKEKPIIVGYIVVLIFDIAVVLGVLIYG